MFFYSQPKTPITLDLKGLPGSEKLSLFEADVVASDVSVFAAAFAGCKYVFHTACPFVPVARAKDLGEEYFVKPVR